MSLDVSKLEKVRELAGGLVQARCPACAEAGGDRKGEHLRIYPDGRYGCCIHPKDGEHRKRIFALAGRKAHLPPAGSFSLRLKAPPALPAAQSVKAVLAASSVRTLRTPVSESEESVPCVPPAPADDVRTGRTPIFKSRAYAREGSPIIDTPTHMCKDWESDVLLVLTDSDGEVAGPPTAAPCGEPAMRLPFLTADGTLSIPFDSPERYHWWKRGERLGIDETLNEVRGRALKG